MVTVTADQAIKHLLAGIQGEATIVDDSGQVLGYFRPKDKDVEKERLYEEARRKIDPEEIKRLKTKTASDRGITTPELLDYLRSLAPER